MTITLMGFILVTTLRSLVATQRSSFPSAVTSWPARRCVSRRAWEAAGDWFLCRSDRGPVRSGHQRHVPAMPSSTPNTEAYAALPGPLELSGPAPPALRGGRQPCRPGGLPGTAGPQELVSYGPCGPVHPRHRTDRSTDHSQHRAGSWDPYT